MRLGKSNNVSVEHRGDFIVVTQAGTQFTVTYHKPPGEPDLMLSGATTDPHADAEEIYQFRADAFAAALQKARELGWIV